MAINAYTGLPGSGKSYGVIEHVVVPALKKGRAVWTNIPINEEAMAAFAGSLPHPFHIDDVRNNPAWFQDVLPKGAVLVLDEAWRLWPSGLKTNNIAEPHRSFLAEHRHMVGDDGFSTEIYLVTQDLAQLAMFARQLVESTYRAHKLTSIGSSTRFRVDIYDGGVTGAKPPKDKRVREIFGKYKPEIYALYKSHTMSDTGVAGDETSSDGRRNIFRGVGFKLFLGVIGFGAVFSIWGLGQVQESYKPHHDAAVPLAVAADSAPRPIKPVPVERGFLAGRQLVIASNRDTGHGLEFVFRVVDGDGRTSRLTLDDLVALGYSLGVINECLVIVNGFGQRSYAQCHRDIERQGFNLASVAADTVSASN